MPRITNCAIKLTTMMNQLYHRIDFQDEPTFVIEPTTNELWHQEVWIAIKRTVIANPTLPSRNASWNQAYCQDESHLPLNFAIKKCQLQSNWLQTRTQICLQTLVIKKCQLQLNWLPDEPPLQSNFAIKKCRQSIWLPRRTNVATKLTELRHLTDYQDEPTLLSNHLPRLANSSQWMSAILRYL